MDLFLLTNHEYIQNRFFHFCLCKSEYNHIAITQTARELCPLKNKKKVLTSNPMPTGTLRLRLYLFQKKSTEDQKKSSILSP